MTLPTGMDGTFGVIALEKIKQKYVLLTTKLRNEKC